MKLLRSVFLTLALLATFSAYADMPVEGHTGIFMIRGADTLAAGDYTYSIGEVSNQYPISGSSAYYFMHQINFNFNQGVTNRLEFGLGFPQTFSDTVPTPQTSQLNMSFKYRLKGSRAEGQATSFTWFTSLYPAPASAGLGSGNRNYGIELNVTQYTPKRDYFLSYGLEQVDDVSVAAGPVVTFTYTGKLYWKLGMEQRVNAHTSFILGTTMHLDFTTFSTRMMLGAAYRFRNQESGFSYTLGFAYNLLANPNEPRYRYMFGLNYRLESPKSRLVRLEQRVQQLEASAQQQQTTDEQQQQQIDALQQQDNTLAQQELPAIRKQISELHNEMTEIEAEQESQAAAIAQQQAASEAETPAPAAPDDSATTEAQTEAQQQTAAATEEAAPVTKPNARVQIVNESGVEGLAQRYAQQLQEKGYDVVESNDVNQMSHKQTYIYYRKGHADEAVAIGHELPNNQIVLQSDTMPEGVDVLVMLGQDVQ